MAIKSFEVDGLGTVRVTKRRTSRSLRLSIGAAGEIKVSIPVWTPYLAGVQFARSKADWIHQNLPELTNQLVSGQRIGKAHRFVFLTAAIDTPSARLAGNEVRVIRPNGMAASHPAVQQSASRAGIRALRAEAEALLPQRLATLAERYDFTYRNVRIKSLKGRWGSCDTHTDIVLNVFLMQLPWKLIDYVLVHELVHTKHLDHSADFWAEFERHVPSAKLLRLAVRQYKPVFEPIAVDDSTTSAGTVA